MKNTKQKPAFGLRPATKAEQFVDSIKEHWVIEPINEWKQLRGKYNWYTCTLIHIYFEREHMAHGYEFHFTLLGLGVYIRYNTDKSLAQFEEWDDDDFEVWDQEELEDWIKEWTGKNRADHTHCPAKDSPCGIEGEHRCCLCKKDHESKS